MSKVKIQGNASGTGVVTLTAPNTNTDRTITLPDGDISLGVGIDDNATSTAITIDANGKVGIGNDTSSGVNASDDYNNPSNYNLVLPAARSTNNKRGIGFVDSGNINSAILGVDEGSGGSQGLSFYSGNISSIAERMRITSAGNVGIGTTSPSYTLDVSGDAQIQNLLIAKSGNNLRLQARSSQDVELWAGGLERMRITSNGKALFNTTSAAGTGFIQINTNIAGDNQAARFKSDGGTVGSIVCTASSTSYNTSSDYRLKELDVPMEGSIDRLKLLRPINFAWKGDGSRTDGFLAHEAGEVVPECATGTKDAMMDEEYEVTPAVMDGDTVVTEAVMGTRSVPDYQGIDQSKLVPLLVASLQEAIARIEELEKV